MAALERGDYPRAIAELETLCRSTPDEAIRQQAQQALITAYRHNGQLLQARSLCERLACELLSPMQAWATQTLAELPQPVDKTGFIPLETATHSSPNFTSQARTEFTPLETPTHPIPKDETGSISGQSSTSPPTETAARPQTPAPATKKTKPTATPALKSSSRFFWGYRLEMAIVAIASFWLVHVSLVWGMQGWNRLLVRLPYFYPIQAFYRDPTRNLLLIAILLTVASPWLIDFLLRYLHGLSPLPLRKLSANHPQAAKTIMRLFREHGYRAPKLKILPTDYPIALTYGNLPRTARLVISQGILDCLDDEELKALFSDRFSQILRWDSFVMSAVLLGLQIPYQIYWQSAKLGDLLSNRLPWCRQEKAERKKKGKIFGQLLHHLAGIVRWTAALISTIAYLYFCLWRLPWFWLARRRQYWGDRYSANATHNPNAQARSLVKIARKMGQTFAKTGQISPLLESFDLAFPISYRQGIHFSDDPIVEQRLAWELAYPQGHGLNLLAPDPNLGDRLAILAEAARTHQLEPAYDLSSPAPQNPPLQQLFANLSALPIIPKACICALIFGSLIQGISWAIGVLADRLDILPLIWLRQDNLLGAYILFAFSFTLLASMNAYFPEIRATSSRLQLGELLADPTLVPGRSRGIRLQGTLIGREGIANWIGQDLTLMTDSGAIALHISSPLSPVANRCFSPHPQQFLNQTVIVRGWLRRQASPWIDVESLRISGDRPLLRAAYPLWLMLVAIAVALWATSLILIA